MKADNKKMLETIISVIAKMLSNGDYAIGIFNFTDEKANPFVVESLRNMGMEVYQVGLNDVSG